MSAAREQHKHACLAAMGLPLLVARRSLPGAAPSRPRLPPREQPRERPRAPDMARTVAQTAVAATSPAPSVATPVVRVPELLNRSEPESRPSPETTQPAPQAPPAAAPAAATALRFSLAVVRSGDLLWLETLRGGGLQQEQRQLIAAMAAAVGAQQPGLQEIPFDWPLHNNPQLDRSAAAAAAALDGFLRRLLQEQPVRAVCLLGADAPLELVSGQLPVPRLALPATRDMLEEPLRKRDAWQVLRTLLQPAG